MKDVKIVIAQANSIVHFLSSPRNGANTLGQNRPDDPVRRNVGRFFLTL